MKIHHISQKRWGAFSQKQQLLMVANELNRAKNLLAQNSTESVNFAYERALELLDLTISDKKWQGKRQNLLELRESLGKLYLEPRQSLNQVLLNHFIQIAEIYE